MRNKAKKRTPPVRTRHVWEVEVRHRDYLRTENDPGKVLHMKHTTLFIESPQRPTERPNIDAAMSKTRRFLSRHQREYGISNILRVAYRGEIDN